ncbi:MAG: hypothetical protein ACFFDW_12715 [Candidatus Thorarchaeota archaeon]
MPYCRECGAFMDEKDSYCKTCGSELVVLTKEEFDNLKQLNNSSQPENIIYGTSTSYSGPAEYRALQKKNFWVWFLFWFTWVGMNVYFLQNVQDLETLNKEPKPNNEVPDTAIPAAVSYMIFFSHVLIPLIIIAHPLFYYFKFQRLNNYLKYHPEKQVTRVFDGYITCMFSIFFFLFTPTGIVFITTYLAQNPIFYSAGIIFLIIGVSSSIFLVVASYLWQRALNERIEMINSQSGLV